MTDGEHNLCRSIITELETDATLAAIPPRIWDYQDQASFPRLSVKAEQGEEMVHNNGVYAYGVTVEYTTRAKLSVGQETALEDTKARLTRLLLDNQRQPEGAEALEPIHERLTDDHFHAFGVHSGTASFENRPNANRKVTIRFMVVGFDKDRLA